MWWVSLGGRLAKITLCIDVFPAFALPMSRSLFMYKRNILRSVMIESHSKMQVTCL